MEGTRKTMSKMIKTPHLAKTPRHSYKTHGPWLSNVAAYKASAWNAGVFSKFEIPIRQELSVLKKPQKSVKLPQITKITKSHTIKFYKSHLITSLIAKRMANAGSLRSLSGSSWNSEHFLTLVLQDIYIYCQFTNLPSGQFATETTCHAPTCLPGIYWNHLSCTNLPARYMSVTTTFGSNALCQVGGKTTVSDGFENRLTSCACLTEPFAATSWVLNRW